MRPLLLLAVLLLPACTAVEAGDCGCNSADPNSGAVVVRWRALDEQIGRLFSRGTCSCSGSLDCPESPPWIITDVALHVTPAGTGAKVGGNPNPCVITAPCIDAELTTNFCLAADPQGSDYVLQLTARVTYNPESPDLGTRCTAEAVYPPAVRRTIRAGQIVNLDAVVLGVNQQSCGPDAAVPLSDGGNDGGPVSGGG